MRGLLDTPELFWLVKAANALFLPDDRDFLGRRLITSMYEFAIFLESLTSKYTYNSLGHLICTVCNCQIKSDRLWNAHLMSRSHKEVSSQYLF